MTEPASLPIVGVIACARQVEGEPAQAVKHRYLEALIDHAGAVPMIVPNNQPPEHAAAIAARLDALLLTGSNSNIAPARYGDPTEGAPPVDEGRDAFAIALIDACIAAAKPVFGICRGLQEINVAFGGTLKDMRDDPAGAHHAPDGVSLDAMFGHNHQVTVEPQSPLAAITGATQLRVNSVHYQSIDRLGAGLAVAARSEDGGIEAIYATATAAAVVAVQWHPEWRPAERPHDLALWAYLGELARGSRARATPQDKQ
ncbi:MAG TPA: gamma-glutamyl-gamma-aminobutyrate hydrolase family protein [Devosiaceae bacterium]|jgi:putative glutamine amidotransferase|nr:gamma-glutamyl-gamma-aminobutyrate hydrolase family protein [Devosiaceae bacterium]